MSAMYDNEKVIFKFNPIKTYTAKDKMIVQCNINSNKQPWKVEVYVDEVCKTLDSTTNTFNICIRLLLHAPQSFALFCFAKFSLIFSGFNCKNE